MYEYNIYPENNPDIFKKVCVIIENVYPEAKKQKILIDVDGTTIQTYSYRDKDIDVFDDYDVGAVYVKSEINLNGIFKDGSTLY